MAPFPFGAVCAWLWLSLAPAAGPKDRPCDLQTFEGAGFTVCRYDPARDELRLYQAAPGRNNAGLGALGAELGAFQARLRFAMNAGMYAPDRSPVGLLMLDGTAVHAAELSSGRGNFYLKPNGVFWTDRRGRAHVEETQAFLAHASRSVWATQSGPLLIAAGRLHPSIGPDGVSRLIRNGVCTDGSGRAAFVITENRVSFGKFARMMRDALSCPDALYLDGTVSSLWNPSAGRMDPQPDLGPLVAVFTR